MKYRRSSRFLSIVLLIAMVLTLMPTVAFAAGTVSKWEQVKLEDITAEDTVAITMNAGGTYYVLPTTGAGSQGQPLAIETGTVSDTSLSTEADTAAVGWKISAVEGGYTIATADGRYLYLTATNNGMRIGSATVGYVWRLTEDSAYLCSEDSNDVTRYLGIYDGQDWRCYNNVTNNIKDQTVGFWKYTGTETDPGEDPGEEPVYLSRLAEAPAAGDQVVIQHPASAMAMTSTASGTKLAAVAAEPAESGEIARSEKMAFMTVSVTEGVYSFELDGKFLTSAETGNGLSFAEDGASDLAKWTLEQLEDGTWIIRNVGANYNGNYNQALEYYNGAFTTYGLKDTNAYWFDFYTEAEEGPETSTIAEALAGETGAEFTVKGVVTMLDGRNVFLQDATGGSCR